MNANVKSSLSSKQIFILIFGLFFVFALLLASFFTFRRKSVSADVQYSNITSFSHFQQVDGVTSDLSGFNSLISDQKYEVPTIETGSSVFVRPNQLESTFGSWLVNPNFSSVDFSYGVYRSSGLSSFGSYDNVRSALIALAGQARVATSIIPFYFPRFCKNPGSSRNPSSGSSFFNYPAYSSDSGIFHVSLIEVALFGFDSHIEGSYYDFTYSSDFYLRTMLSDGSISPNVVAFRATFTSRIPNNNSVSTTITTSINSIELKSSDPYFNCITPTTLVFPFAGITSSGLPVYTAQSLWESGSSYENLAGYYFDPGRPSGIVDNFYGTSESTLFNPVYDLVYSNYNLFDVSFFTYHAYNAFNSLFSTTSSDSSTFDVPFLPNTNANLVYENGYNNGYSIGYNAGVTSGFKNPVSTFVAPIDAFLGLDIGGGLTLGTIFLIAISVSVALIFLKMFGGG